MDLINKTAVVAGGTGNIGIGIVKQLTIKGAKVIVPYRNEDKLQALKAYLGNGLAKAIVPIKADFSSFNNALKFQKELLTQTNSIAVAVASLGGWWQGGRLTTVSGEDYERVMNENVHSHFYFARAISPLLKEQGYGTYVAINGPGGLYAQPGAELIAIAGWMHYKMIEYLNKELRQYGAKAYDLFIAGIHTRQPDRKATINSITPEEIGEHILKLHEEKVENPKKVGQKFFNVKIPWFSLEDK